MRQPPNDKPSRRVQPTATSFAIPVRIYYEDTDAGGVAYYANYLKYLERCRTEWLRSIGHDQSAMLREHQLAFMVRRVEADFLRPAVLDDVLTVDLNVEKLGGAQIVFVQNVKRGDALNPGADAEILLTARVKIVCVNMTTMKPMPIPGWMKNNLRLLL